MLHNQYKSRSNYFPKFKKEGGWCEN